MSSPYFFYHSFQFTIIWVSKCISLQKCSVELESRNTNRHQKSKHLNCMFLIWLTCLAFSSMFIFFLFPVEVLNHVCKIIVLQLVLGVLYYVVRKWDDMVLTWHWCWKGKKSRESDRVVWARGSKVMPLFSCPLILREYGSQSRIASNTNNEKPVYG